ncbi:MAG TPA: Ig-like domain repeat protein [Gemmatimonadales bacterium]|nr:Ig-like domain repeat protein [Gemmatimonadales bacterium]
MTTTRRRLAYSLSFGLAAASSACGGDGLVLPNESRPASISVVSGDGQSAAAGAALGQPLVVSVVDALERPVQGQTVAFTVDAGGGTVAPATASTDADGLASANWTLGTGAGTQSVKAQVQAAGLPAPLVAGFTATATSGTGAILEPVSGDNQTAPVKSALADSLVVRVTDALQNPVAGVEVQWSVDGGGSISPVTVTTGADGLAAAERVLGSAAGTQTAQAAATGLAPVTFTHTAVAANPTVLRLVSGDGQTGSVGNPLAEPVVVRLEDENGNGVGDKSVTFVAGPGAGSTDPVNATTDPNGFASSVWTLGSSLGGKTLTAIFSGLPPVAFTATAVAATPTQLAFTRPPQTTAAGASFSPSIQVTVQDAAGNTVTSANDAVTLAIGSNPAGGTLSGTVTVNAVNGVASFGNVSIDQVGSGYTLTASAAGLAGATSPAFDIVPTQVNTIIVITSDTPDPSTIGVPFTVTWNLNSSGTAPITGNVTVTVNGTADTCSAPAALGAGSCDLTITLNGSHRLTATFPGDANYKSSTDIDAHQVKGTTSTTLASSVNPSTVGQSITLTAHVAPSGGSTGSPGGQVQFMEGATLLGTRSVNGAGDAALDISSLGEGLHSITAAYQGSTTFEASTSAAVDQQVNAAPNVPPTAVDDATGYSVLEDGTLNAGTSVLQNDSDNDGPSPLVARNASDPANGTVALNSDGTFTYTPDPDFNGTDTFTYEAFDGAAASTATVTITVTPVNDAPSFNSGGNVTQSDAAGQFDQPWATALSAGPTNESGQSLSFVTTLVNPLNALLFAQQPSVDPTGRLTFTAAALASGTVDVQVHIVDDGGTANGGVDASGDQPFTITLTP